MNALATIEGFDSLTTMDTLRQADDYQGLEFAFDRVKMPVGGGTSFELPGEENEMVKAISGVIIYNHPAYAYYLEKYTGGHLPPACSSRDGVVGTGEPGGLCASCPHNRYGSGEGASKKCKNRRMLYILRENELFPIMLSLPSGSLKAFTQYVKSLLTKGLLLNQAVTKISLRKVSNSSGIAYSQAVFTLDRILTEDECAGIQKIARTVRGYANPVTVDVGTGEVV